MLFPILMLIALTTASALQGGHYVKKNSQNFKNFTRATVTILQVMATKINRNHCNPGHKHILEHFSHPGNHT